MDSKKSNKITEIVRLQQILKKWKKLANAAPKNNNNNNNNNNSTTTSSCTTNNSSSSSSSSSSSKGINKFLKKTLSFSDRTSSSTNLAAMDVAAVPKGFLAVSVGGEEKRFIIRTEYLGHQAFGILLREAEEEYGFQQEGVLKIPCQVSTFEKILKLVEDKTRSSSDLFFFNNDDDADDTTNNDNFQIGYCYSPDCDQLTNSSHHPQMMCR